MNDGTIDVTVNGGVDPYTYQWSNGINSEDLQNLAPGDYELIVTDSQGCFENAIYQITEPDSLTATVSVINVACFGD